MKCAECDDRDCYEGRNCTPLKKEILARLDADPEAQKLLRASASIEADHYMKLTRLEETLEFAHRMEYAKLGVAFCIGMAEEARTLVEILKGDGFEVTSVCCKVCGIDKGDYGMKRLHGPERAVEATCNPVGQAMVLNAAGCQFNVMVGLCVGHDALFLKSCEAPTTVLVAKDRVLGHNPVAALYSGYYRRKLARRTRR